MDFILYLVYLVFVFIIKIIPKFLMRYILLGLSKLVYMIDVRHKRIAYINLDLAYQDKITISKKKEIIKKSYDNLLFNLYAFIDNQNATLEDMDKKIILKNESYILNAIKENKKIILVTAHYGDWELAIPYVSLKFKSISVISKPIKNKYLNKMFQKVRHNHNLEMFEKHGAAKKMIKALKNNRIVAMAIDQSVSEADSSIVNFFDHKVTQTDAPIRLASKLEAVVIPFIFVRDSFEQHQAVFYQPIKIKKEISDQEIIKHSQDISNIFESQIKKNPNDWFWQHRRFKECYKDLYN